MKIQTNQETVDAIKAVMEKQPDRPAIVRVFMAGMGCAGPSFGLSLDELKDGDLVDESSGVKFVMTQELFDQFGEIKVEFMENGYYVAPVNQQESACGSCGGGCH